MYAGISNYFTLLTCKIKASASSKQIYLPARKTDCPICVPVVIPYASIRFGPLSEITRADLGS